jgi:hypothetical protein
MGCFGRSWDQLLIIPFLLLNLVYKDHDMKKILLPLLIFILLFVVSCKQKESEKETFNPVFSTFKNDAESTNPSAPKEETYYGILTPVEICVIFNRLSIPLSTAALNPVSNSEHYLSNSKAAINTGIYGVDFGYLKMFGMGQEVIDYMVTIRDLSNKLGIPDNLLTEPLKRVQNDMADPDTITSMMKTSYIDIENQLRESGRESTAGLIVMGGWVEAMYLATQLVYNPKDPDPEVVQRIAEQKYSLTSLLSFMKNYYDDPIVVYYTKKLKYLKKYFDSFDIYFKIGDLEINTTRQVLLSSGAKMTITVDTLNKIRDYVAKLRTEMVTTN